MTKTIRKTKTYTLPEQTIEQIEKLAEVALSSRTQVIVDAILKQHSIVFGIKNKEE